MSTKETLPTTCLICGKGVPDYVAQFCCSGTDCGCHGQPLDPCVCSQECYDAVIKGIGKPFEQRRADYITALRTRLDAAETWKAKQQKALIAMALELCSTKGPGVIDGIRQLKNRLDATEKELFSTHDLFDRAHERAKAAEKELTKLKEANAELAKTNHTELLKILLRSMRMWRKNWNVKQEFSTKDIDHCIAGVESAIK